MKVTVSAEVQKTTPQYAFERGDLCVTPNGSIILVTKTRTANPGRLEGTVIGHTPDHKPMCVAEIGENSTWLLPDLMPFYGLVRIVSTL